MTNEQAIKICEQVSADTENDAKEFDGKPFTGKTMAEYMGYHGAAIKALSDVLKLVILNLPLNTHVPEEAKLQIVPKTYSRNDVIDILETCSLMGWYCVKMNDKSIQWEHPDENGIFKSTKDFFDFYYPKIDWERGDLEELHDTSKVYAAHGNDKNGTKYIGDWNESGGEVEITNIEIA